MIEENRMTYYADIHQSTATGVLNEKHFDEECWSEGAEDAERSCW